MNKYLQPLRKYWISSTLIIGLFLVLISLYMYQWDGDNLQEKFWSVLDPVTTLLTFITTLAIFYIQAYNNWENSLEKSLTISYYIDEDGTTKEILRIVNAYLSGESDIRQWAQSLGGQVFGLLSLDIAWDESPPKINQTGTEYFKAYEVALYLPVNPLNNPEVRAKILPSFLERKLTHSLVRGDADHLPIIWERRRPNIRFK
jgi:hypothetical protein